MIQIYNKNTNTKQFNGSFNPRKTQALNGNFTPPLDKLAQLPTKKLSTLKNKALSTLQKRARSKWYTNQIIPKLLNYTKHVAKDETMRKYFQTAYYCSSLLTQRGKNITAKYCNNRLCNMCNRIRTGKLMNGYIGQFEGKKLHFVTLTIPNVIANELKPSITEMTKNMSNIIRTLRERHKIPLNGIRKLEVTYNAKTNTYHPHIHLLIDQDKGNKIIELWLKRYPKAKSIAQDTRPADENSYKELFKYTTKIAATKSKHNSGVIEVHTQALYIIIKSMYKKRAFQPFGDIKKVNEDIIEEELKGQTYEEIKEETEFKEWFWMGSDWMSIDGELLTNYEPPDIVFSG